MNDTMNNYFVTYRMEQMGIVNLRLVAERGPLKNHLFWREKKRMMRENMMKNTREKERKVKLIC